MNQKLLQEVREQKLQSRSDQEIITILRTNYPLEEIQKCLAALEYMRPTEVEVNSSQNAPAVKDQSNRGINRSLKRHKILITALLIFVIIPLAAPTVLRCIKIFTVKGVDATLIDKYDVSRSYDAGSTHKCIRSGVVSIGQIMGGTVCSLITAKIYYPRVKITSYVATEYSTGSPIERTIQSIEYVNAAGKALTGDDGYIKFGVSTVGDIPYPDRNLGLEIDDHLTFSGVGGNATESSQGTIGGKWIWGSGTNWLGYGTQGDKLQNEISKKIKADMPPVAGAPTASAALKKGTAPLVVMYSSAYCHNIPVPGFVNSCVIPD